MKANELRIGNLVYDVEDGNYYEIESIYLNYSNVYWVSYRDGSINCRVDALEPVVLTEEWLLKFGYIGFRENRYFKLSQKATIDLKDKTINIYHSDIFGDITLNMPNSIHQLQNLYFALTNEELTMK